MGYFRWDRPPGPKWTRRRLLGSLSGLPLLGLTGCRLPDPNGGSSTPVLAPLIDAHCHLFNVTDLPASSFARIVMLKQYPHPPPPKDGEELLKRIFDAVQERVSRGVMTADQEARQPNLKMMIADAPELSDADERQLDQYARDAEKALRKAPPQTGSCEPESGFPALSPRSVIGWLKDLRSPRARLAAKLTRAHAKSGFASRLLCPALVDYSNWLDQPLQSPLPDQVRAGGKLAINPSLPPVHGYVAFDPLRRALVRNKRPVKDGSWDPLALARDALVNHGYLGIKLYPPMGFRPSGNAETGQHYPHYVTEAMGIQLDVGTELDRSLDELWKLCLDLDAPVLAHGANSNAAGTDYGRRGDPAFWLPVVARFPKLRVLLGHFGRFGTYSADQPRGSASCEVPFEATWEAAIGRFVQANPDSFLYADLSFLSEIFDEKDRQRSIAGMKKYLKLDEGGRHLVFGSDWVMLGVTKEYSKDGGYPYRIVQFLKDCGLGDPQISGIMYENAVRLLGLAEGAGARDRLLKFYATHGLPPGRLPS